MNALGVLIDARVLDFVFIASSAVLTLCLFATSKYETARRAHEQQSAFDELAARVQALSTALNQLERQTSKIAEQPVGPVAADPKWSGVNLTKRTNALRLHRAGTEQNVICHTIGLAKGELALMIKVQNMITKRAEEVQKQ